MSDSLGHLAPGLIALVVFYLAVASFAFVYTWRYVVILAEPSIRELDRTELPESVTTWLDTVRDDLVENSFSLVAQLDIAEATPKWRHSIVVYRHDSGDAYVTVEAFSAKNRPARFVKAIAITHQFAKASREFQLTTASTTHINSLQVNERCLVFPATFAENVVELVRVHHAIVDQLATNQAPYDELQHQYNDDAARWIADGINDLCEHNAAQGFLLRDEKSYRLTTRGMWNVFTSSFFPFKQLRDWRTYRWTDAVRQKLNSGERITLDDFPDVSPVLRSEFV